MSLSHCFCFILRGNALFSSRSRNRFVSSSQPFKGRLFSVWHWGILPAKHCLNLACLFVFLSVELTLPSEIILESRSAGWIVRHTAKSCQPFDFMTFLQSNYTKKVPLFALPIRVSLRRITVVAVVRNACVVTVQSVWKQCAASVLSVRRHCAGHVETVCHGNIGFLEEPYAR